MNFQIANNAESVAKLAATFIAAEARAAIQERGRFIMAISGGKTPWIMLRHLAEEKLEWSNVHLFQVDERIAPAGSADRNWTHLQESLNLFPNSTADAHSGVAPVLAPSSMNDTLSRCAPATPCSASSAASFEIGLIHLHPMPVEAADSEAGTATYTTLLHNIGGEPFSFDLIHLGLGADGHTASLIPGDRVLKVIDRDVALAGPYQGHLRMTLTYPIINRSRKILWVVTGKEKQTALQQLLNKDHSIPAGSVLQANATIIADADAAAGLAEEKRTLNVGIASDHGGFELKEELTKRLKFLGYCVTDFGAFSLATEDDYPDYVTPLAQAVAAGTLDRGIAICGSGVGAAVCANKIQGARAALIHDHFSAKQGVEDDHMNILCMGGRTIGLEVAWDLAQVFLTSSYSQEKRHLRRLEKVAALEKK